MSTMVHLPLIVHKWTVMPHYKNRGVHLSFPIIWSCPCECINSSNECGDSLAGHSGEERPRNKSVTLSNYFIFMQQESFWWDQQIECRRYRTRKLLFTVLMWHCQSDQRRNSLKFPHWTFSVYICVFYCYSFCFPSF